MPFPKPAEIPTHVGCLDDGAFTANDGGDAYCLRELIRSRNTMVSRGGLMFRYVARGAHSDTVLGGEALQWADPFWQAAIPVCRFPCPKKAGITSASLAIRVQAASASTTQIQIATLGCPFAQDPWTNTSNSIAISGTGSITRSIMSNVKVQPSPDEAISIYMRGFMHPAIDPQMSTVTYGGVSTGIVSGNSRDMFMAAGYPAWNTGVTTAPDKGGHYVIFTNTTDSTTVAGPYKVIGVIRSTTSDNAHGLYCYPQLPLPDALVDTTFTIYKIPEFRICSVAMYGNDRLR